MIFNENDLLREKTELLYLRISKLAMAKVLLKLEFDTEDQVLSLSLTGQSVRTGIELYEIIPSEFSRKNLIID